MTGDHQLDVRIYDGSISVPEHRQLRDALRRAAETGETTVVSFPGGQAAIGPTRMLERDHSDRPEEHARITAHPGGAYTVTLQGEYIKVRSPAASYPAALAELRAMLVDEEITDGIRSLDDMGVFYVQERSGSVPGWTVKFPVPLDQIVSSWDRPDATEAELATWDAMRPFVSAEALCLLCGEVFNPHGPGADDLTHLQHAEDESPCGGPGVLLGAWG